METLAHHESDLIKLCNHSLKACHPIIYLIKDSHHIQGPHDQYQKLYQYVNWFNIVGLVLYGTVRILYQNGLAPLFSHSQPCYLLKLGKTSYYWIVQDGSIQSELIRTGVQFIYKTENWYYTGVLLV